MRQRLGLAAALLGDPELLILDEPANGLDPEGVRWLRDFLRRLAAAGRTVLISSHVLAEVAQTADRVLIISRGRLVLSSPLAELTARAGGAVRVRSGDPQQLTKIRSTRTTLGLILAMIALILLFTLLTGLLTHPSGLASKEDQRQLLSVGSFAGVFFALAGVLLVTSEYRFGTIRPTILFNPARSHVLAAKVRRRRIGRNRIRGARRGSQLGDRVRDSRRAWHYRRARQRRHSAAHARRARGRGSVGRDRRRPRRDHPQPSRRRHRAARLGSRRRP
jgi:hypothetical protein